jgi:hypothetical protein
MPFYSPKLKTRFALRISGNDALEFGYRAVSGRILCIVLQHDVQNLRIARLENHLRDDVCKFFLLACKF